MARILRRLAVVLAVALAANAPASGPREVVAGGGPIADWRKLLHADGAVDIAGPRADGRFALAAGGRLFTLGPNGDRKTPFARGRRGYSSQAGEPYIAYAEDAGAPDCSFRAGEVFAIEPRDRPRVIRISRSGRATRFAPLPDAEFLSGIAFDRVGSFGNRLLVTDVHDKKTDAASTNLLAIDCRGEVTTIASGGPRVEGGMEVAPESFGAFGGRLIAPDERSGTVYAFDPSGGVATLADSGLPAGGDVGVESVGFVPPGFGPGDRALLADLGVKAGVGTDSVLALGGGELSRGAVLPGDLLVATETGAETIRVRCAASCEVSVVASGPAAAHAEGHIAFTRGG